MLSLQEQRKQSHKQRCEIVQNVLKQSSFDDMIEKVRQAQQLDKSFVDFNIRHCMLALEARGITLAHHKVRGLVDEFFKDLFHQAGITYTTFHFSSAVIAVHFDSQKVVKEQKRQQRQTLKAITRDVNKLDFNPIIDAISKAYASGDPEFHQILFETLEQYDDYDSREVVERVASKRLSDELMKRGILTTYCNFLSVCGETGEWSVWATFKD